MTTREERHAADSVTRDMENGAARSDDGDGSVPGAEARPRRRSNGLIGAPGMGAKRLNGIGGGRGWRACSGSIVSWAKPRPAAPVAWRHGRGLVPEAFTSLTFASPGHPVPWHRPPVRNGGQTA